MKWPRGKFNGRRIVGVEFKIQLDLTTWRWIPMAGWVWKYSGGLHWLCFRTFTNWSYE